ncbi:hypothetical protein [Asticcacaulis sp. AC402]|uniref:hypothetical protein n=1 Tax=Asticcacaulis sp. AC402 TaxID=1282361 RepID=UPI0004223E3A|nr:hypothetical protein [Asticcacaulis sp. AC402]
MSKYLYRLIDNNTGEEVYASEGFTFSAPPIPEHRIHDAELRERFGGPCVVNKVEDADLGDGTIEVRVYVDGVEERENGDTQDNNYRPT